MEEMISYVFGTLKDYERFMARVDRTLKRQRKTNRIVIALAVGMAGYAYWQNLRIKWLTAQMEKMIRPEGE